ncbi:unnamed protein product, partial [Staurois parvus]
MTAGTDWRHCWALTGSTAGWHCWAADGHRWVALLDICEWHCWAQVGSTSGWHCLALIIRALMISALMIGADPSSDNCQLSVVLSSRCDNVRKVQPKTGNC